MNKKMLNLNETTYKKLLTFKLKLSLIKGQQLSFDNVLDDLMENSTINESNLNHKIINKLEKENVK